LLLILAIAVVSFRYSRQFGVLENRQAEVAARGAQVMPFDLEQTIHVFQPLEDGGVQTVTAKDPASVEQIELIRGHLQEEAARFRRGDFSDPAKIHGDAMPGLAELRAGASRIDVRYTELSDGAQLRYTTSDPALITALHHWFQAQLSDHGQHATDH
jgi:hypothetical protein